jgi:hypothetical protein
MISVFVVTHLLKSQFLILFKPIKLLKEFVPQIFAFQDSETVPWPVGWTITSLKEMHNGVKFDTLIGNCYQ